MLRFVVPLGVAMLPGLLSLTAPADVVLWDNYPANVVIPDYSMTSERNTELGEPSWTVDDARIEPGPSGFVQLGALEWVGVRDPRYSYSGADVILLNESLTESIALDNLAYLATPFTPEPNGDPVTRQTYTGRIDFGALDVPWSHFYVGVRLVGGGTYEGRNFFVMHSNDTSVQGDTGGFTLCSTIGAPYWRPSSDVWDGVIGSPRNFEFAFRFYAPVPEPTAAVGLAGGGLAMLLRRRNGRADAATPTMQ